MLTLVSPSVPPAGGVAPPRSAELPAAEAVREAGNAAIEWQLAHMGNPEELLPRGNARTQDPIGWVQGTFLHGATQWAVAMNEEGYLTTLRNHLSKSRWRLGARLYHADDHVIAQSYLTMHGVYGDPVMLAALIRKFNRILRDPPLSDMGFAPKGKLKAQGYAHDCQRRWCWADALLCRRLSGFDCLS